MLVGNLFHLTALLSFPSDGFKAIGHRVFLCAIPIYVSEIHVKSAFPGSWRSRQRSYIEPVKAGDGLHNSPAVSGNDSELHFELCEEKGAPEEGF